MPLTRKQLLAIGIVAALTLIEPTAAIAAGNDVGANLSKLLRHYASELYAGILAIVSLVFLVNRRYGELGTFLVASVVVAWLVFSPDQVSSAARAIGKQIF
ncbi:hypothetical protein NBH00_21630 [Paraconexibacter antarcticus]|uniref:TrbC/VIRB2 family protein n=1 Tax=Paraconexibacter antarcticus TaxID=2949664 RepID=A0ABY5DSJ6_9ACTN|nr:hypothetical protein [Paraconexibacter antarcticus]UTI63931.1 hypothetical protein NBH00_21630 [Paraconexibacter antarcticus]